MKKLFIIAMMALLPLSVFSQTEWVDLAVTEDMEFYIDPSSILDMGGKVYAITKTVYMTPESRDAYVGKIKRVFKPKDADKKIAKWEGFGYTVNYGVYDCTNKRFKIMNVEDFRSDGSRIVKTRVKEENAKWLLVDIDTVGDHLLFYICDYENRQ